jgi:germination protein M
MKSSKDKYNLATAFFYFHQKSFFRVLSPGLLRGLYVFLITCIAMSMVLSGCTLLGGSAANGSKTDVSAASAADNTASQDSQQQTSTESVKETPKETTVQTQETTAETTDQTSSAATDVMDTGESTINVYYADAGGEFLVGEARTVSGAGKFVDAIYEMMKNPIDSSLFVLIPSTAKINSVTVSNQVAKVDFSQSFLDDRFVSDSVDILLKYAVVNTLTEFPEIHAVEFYIDGKKLDILGQLDMTDPIYRRGDLIKK